MYVGKRGKSILAVLLICGLLVVHLPCRAYAVGPVVFGPALKYAIGAGIVSGGLYAANKEAINYAINDYWTKASDHVKQQWQSAVIYGTGIGIIVLNDPLKGSIKQYLDMNYQSGYHEKQMFSDLQQGVPSVHYKSIDGYSCGVIEINGKYYLARYRYGVFEQYFYGLSTDYNDVRVMADSAYYDIVNGLIWLHFYDPKDRKWKRHMQGEYSGDATCSIISEIYEFYGDTAGFGNATADRPDIKVPCPPVPAAEWPDQWIDDLLDDLNLTGNPALDDETFVEECEWEWDWYWDDNVAHVYRVRKGEPPKDPDDEPIRIPPPLPPIPEIPYPEPEPIPQPAEPCPYCPPNPYPSPEGDPCPNPYCPNQPNPVPVPVPQPAAPAEPCPYCPPNPYPSPNGEPCPNPYCPNQPNPQPLPQPPPDIQPYYDDPEINWEPLRRSLYELTEKFPFSLPWDLMRGIQSLESNQWDRQIRINVGDGIWPEMTIDLRIFDGIARITRVVLLVVFDLGLIFATRRLMGGDV